MEGIPFKELRRLLKEQIKKEKNPPLNKIKTIHDDLVLVNGEDWSWSFPIPKGGVAQVVEHQTENLSVGGADPSPTT